MNNINMEIGGYIEFEHFQHRMLHESAIALNCGRRCLTYLIRSKQIRHLWLPKFLCHTVAQACEEENVSVSFYRINHMFLPDFMDSFPDEWIYLVNYYGQIDNTKLLQFSDSAHLIVDNAQAYFQQPLPGIDTIYTCRKFFGVPDGAFLYTEKILEVSLEQDESFPHMNFLLGRFERSASAFYGEYAKNNERFEREPLKRMSKLTENLLHSLDYQWIRERRKSNFKYLHERLGKHNRLTLTVPEGAFMYPLWLANGRELRKRLIHDKIYIPVLWPNVLQEATADSIEYDMAANILPLPVDQRYGNEAMQVIVEKITDYLGA